jgi:drug/metabolite transporter (DMT)-like permease
MQPYQLATISLITPVVAVLEGALFAQESIPLLMMIAIAIILVAVGTVLLASAEEQKDKDRILLVQE